MDPTSARGATPRYWGAMILASMCGANLGDFLPDTLLMKPGQELAVLFALFAVIVMTGRTVQHGREAVYWLTILVVRAAATEIGDLLVQYLHLGYLAAGTGLAAIMAISLLPDCKPSAIDRAFVGGRYWFRMLIAGTLGTVIGDGVAHAFPSLVLGVPVSAAIATLAVTLTLWIRAALAPSSGIGYWLAIICVRWLGTNAGDIFKYLVTLPVSMMCSGTAVALVLSVRRRRYAQSDRAT